VKVGSAGRAAGAGWNEKVADGREHVDEPLQPSGRSKALPRPFSPAERQMRILRPIVEPLVRAVFDFWHDLTVIRLQTKTPSLGWPNLLSGLWFFLRLGGS
jgi:hypothetical protein